MVASRYSNSGGTLARPSLTNSAGRTPDSRSRIIHPKVRTVSLTQKGMRHTMKSSEPKRPRQFRDDPGDRKREQQCEQRRDHGHDRRAQEYMPVQRLLEEGLVLRETGGVVARADLFAKRQYCKIDVRQYHQCQEPEQ